MNHGLAVLSQSDKLLEELTQQLEGSTVLRCATLGEVHEKIQSGAAHAVILHLDAATLGGSSAGRFVAELDEAVENVPQYAIVDPACPPRLHKLVSKLVDEVFSVPVDYHRLREILSGPQDLEAELEGFCHDVPHKELTGRTRTLVTFAPEMFEMLDEMRVAAKHDVTCLLVGETGSGKTFLARLIHELSDRGEERFCTVACGALPPDLLESELFGHVRGSFTGADRDREGKFAAAGRGTLLLDEIDVLPLEQQAKLLRVIETGEYEQVGSNETQHSQARLIVASNYNLEDLVRAGTFRTDLYYRLNILHFRLPPLRERPLDIEYLARKFALQHSRTHKIQLRAIEPEFFDALRRYNWPGNVREMENVIRRAVLYCQRGLLSVRDLPSAVRNAAAAFAPQQGVIVGGIGSAPYQAGATNGYPRPAGYDGGGQQPPANGYGGPQPQGNLNGSVATNGGTYPAQQRNGLAYPSSPAPTNGYVNGNGNGNYVNGAYVNGSYVNGGQSNGYGAQQPVNGGGTNGHHAMGQQANEATLEAKVDLLEQKIIEEALRRNNHRRKETAAELGISRVTLYNKMKKFSLL